MKRREEIRADLEDRWRRALEGLIRRVPRIAEGGSHHPDRCDDDRRRHGVILVPATDTLPEAPKRDAVAEAWSREGGEGLVQGPIETAGLDREQAGAR